MGYVVDIDPPPPGPNPGSPRLVTPQTRSGLLGCHDRFTRGRGRDLVDNAGAKAPRTKEREKRRFIN